MIPALAGRLPGARRLLPGVLLCATIAAASSFLSEHYGGPAMLFALLLGIAFHFLSEEGPCIDGIAFTAKHLLRIGVALLGTQVTFREIEALGLGPLVLVLLTVLATIAAGWLIARATGRPGSFGLLAGGAVAICGASAALAISAVLPERRDSQRDTLFTVIAVTTLSTVAMIVYPLVYAVMGLGQAEIGILLGATIHDVAQVVGAGYAISDETGTVATYVKLMRVAMLPVVVLGLALAFRVARRGGRPEAAHFPWFVVAFAGLLAVNSAGFVPVPAADALGWASRGLLVAAIAALGVKTSLKAMVAVGWRRLFVVVATTLVLFVLATGLSFVIL